MAQSNKAQKRERQRQNRAIKLEQQAAAEKKRRFWRSAGGFALIAVLVIGGFFVLQWLTGGDDSDSSKSESSSSDKTTQTTAGKSSTTAAAPPGKYSAPPPMTIDARKTYVATVATSEGSFQITLDPKQAPQTVNSFVFLANEGFYDGTTFHRVVTDFVIQGGDPKGDGTGGPGYTLPDEPPADGYRQYSVAMANSGPGTTGSQFFVVTTSQGAKNLGGPPYLYSALGTVTSGKKTVEKINGLGSSSSQGTPTKTVTIDKITIAES
ncbi:MAG: peptidylprolyl isomerase [Actinobacteria bacterium]|nr:peptidylprolyl isomerase [Actinomycetota bacterium]